MLFSVKNCRMLKALWEILEGVYKSTIHVAILTNEITESIALNIPTTIVSNYTMHMLRSINMLENFDPRYVLPKIIFLTCRTVHEEVLLGRRRQCGITGICTNWACRWKANFIILNCSTFNILRDCVYINDLTNGKSYIIWEKKFCILPVEADAS